MKFLKKAVKMVSGFLGAMRDDHVGAYAAQTAYFIMLSFFPFIILLVTLIRYTSITPADVYEAARAIFPASMDSFILSLINEVYSKTAVTVSVSAKMCIRDRFNRYGITILQGYGMTECSPVISTTVSWNIRKESVGQLLPNCEAKTVDEELWVRGSSVMLGYYKMPEETAEALEDGWLKTGDLGYADEEGFVYLTGRKKNLIITKNGENVSPEELENKIGENRLVQEIDVYKRQS